jgi:hypothetical protein
MYGLKLVPFRLLTTEGYDWLLNDPRKRAAKIPDRIKMAKKDTCSLLPFLSILCAGRSGTFANNRLGAFRQRGPMFKSIPKLTSKARTLACLAAIAAIPFSASVSLSPQTGGASGDPQPHDVSSWPPINPLANRTADANRILEDSMKAHDNQKRFEQFNLQRRKEMTSDTEKLLALANQLKAEADKASTGNASKDVLSMDAVRQAEQIEKLAHSVREKMRSSVSN